MPELCARGADPLPGEPLAAADGADLPGEPRVTATVRVYRRARRVTVWTADAAAYCVSPSLPRAAVAAAVAGAALVGSYVGAVLQAVANAVARLLERAPPELEREAREALDALAEVDAAVAIMP